MTPIRPSRRALRGATACVLLLLLAPARGAGGPPGSWVAHRLEPGPATRFPGPFLCDAVSFYIVHHGGPLQVRFEERRPSADLKGSGGIRHPHAVFWQLYDADEQQVDMGYHRFTDDAETGKTFEVAMDDAKPGVYQFRYAKSAGNSMKVDLRTEPECSVGVMPCRCRLHRGVAGQFDEAYLYAPPGD